VNPNTVGANGQPTQTTQPAPNTIVATPTGVAAGIGATPTSTPGTAAAEATANNAANGIQTAGNASTFGQQSTVSFNALPPAVQAQIAAQIPAGAQLGNITAQTTAQGTTYRAQVMQNGVTSELALTGAAQGAGLTGSTTVAGTASTTAVPEAGLGSFVVGTPYGFAQLPVGVQTAFAQQGAGGGTNFTYTPSAAGGGVFQGMVNGRPVAVNVAGNGMVVPNGAQNIARVTRVTPAATNEVRVEDLPQAVRDAIRASLPYAEITRIRKSNSASGNLYDVTLRNQDESTTLQISESGTIVREGKDVNIAVNTDRATVYTNEPPRLDYKTLPSGIRDAIETHTTPDSIKMLALTNLDAKTVYAVDYVDKDAIRNRLYIGKEGVVVDTQTNLFGIAAFGRAVVVDDLPAPAREVVQRQAERSAVTRIDLAMHGLEPVYVVTYQRDGEARQMVVTRDGKRIDSAVGAPAVSVIGSDKAPTGSEAVNAGDIK
jgi:hypothetical protein